MSQFNVCSKVTTRQIQPEGPERRVWLRTPGRSWKSHGKEVRPKEVSGKQTESRGKRLGAHVQSAVWGCSGGSEGVGQRSEPRVAGSQAKHLPSPDQGRGAAGKKGASALRGQDSF